MAKSGQTDARVAEFITDLRQALAEAGSLRAAARRLQMDPATLLRRKKKYQAQRRLLPD